MYVHLTGWLPILGFHAKNPIYLDTHYANMFSLWDRVFGTYQRGVDDHCSYYFPVGRYGDPVSDDLSDGFADGGEAIRCTERLCIQRISVEACVENLKRGSCSATLAQLEVCTRVVGNSCRHGTEPCARNLPSPVQRSFPSCPRVLSAALSSWYRRTTG